MDEPDFHTPVDALHAIRSRREVLEMRRRALALKRLRAAAAEGAVDLDLLEDKRNYRR